MLIWQAPASYAASSKPQSPSSSRSFVYICASYCAGRRNLARSHIDEKQETFRPMRPDEPPNDLYTLLNFFEYMGPTGEARLLDKADVWDHSDLICLRSTQMHS